MGKVETVLGPITPEEMGRTITHEHLRFNITMYEECPKDPKKAAFFNAPVTMNNLFQVKQSPYSNYDNCIQYDVDIVCEELEPFKMYGGGTVVDVSSEGLCNDKYVESLVEISEKSGVHVVAGIGNFCAFNHPPRIKEMTEDQIAEGYIDQIRNGFLENRSVKPGIIGEMGTGYVIHPDEIKCLRAACRAQLETGLPMSIHLHLPKRNGHQVLDIIKQEGVDLERVILCHIDCALTHTDIDFNRGVDYIRSLAERGAYVEFDLCGNAEFFPTPAQGTWWNPTDYDRARAIKILCESGFGTKILTSHDAGHKYMLKKWGGWGYSHAINGFRNTCILIGIDERIVDGFSIENPRRIMTITK